MRTHRDPTIALLTVLVAVELLAPRVSDLASLQRWATVFAAICVQAAPYVALGTLVSALVAIVPPTRLDQLTGHLSRHPVASVPGFGLLATLLPGCECGSVPAATGLVERGVPLGAALAFMVSAPGANPVVLAATAAAFPGQPEIVLARFAAALLVAVVIGVLAHRGVFGLPAIGHCTSHAHGPARHRLRDATVHAADELLRALGLLSAGAAAAAVIAVWFPRALLEQFARQPVAGVLVLAGCAVLLSLCSQADAFIARTFVGFSRTAVLTFLVVGPVVDLKLVAMQSGAFGGRFVARFAPVALGVAIAVACMVSALLI